MKYEFQLIKASSPPISDPKILLHRPFVEETRRFADTAGMFVPDESLVVAMNVAVALGEPLLLTGESGTGKTQAAYFLARQLNVPLIHFQVKSDSVAKDLFYDFDNIQYFHDANTVGSSALSKDKYVSYRGLGKAILDAKADSIPRVLLLDEIDKAPRDFPNDLLLEIDQMRFVVKETGAEIEAPDALRPVMVITSNSERRLPGPFLRRCVFHNIEFDESLVARIVKQRRSEYKNISDDLVDLAVKRFFQLRMLELKKAPATGELLAWLSIMSFALNTSKEILEERLQSEDLRELPYIGVLIKDRADLDKLT